jgi:hypothetical protein
MGSGRALLCGCGGGQIHCGSKKVGTMDPGVLVAGPTAFGEKCNGQCQGAGDAEPDARMEVALEEPPGPRGCRDERENTEAELNMRLAPKHERRA